MIIWILAVVLFASLGFVGYSLGAIRVGFSLIGLMVAALLTHPLTGLVKPLLKGLFGAFGSKNPLLIWAVAPVVAFLVVLTLFKVLGKFVHTKVEVYYKYKAGDLQLALWERMNKRVGACLGLVNGLVYLLLISTALYVLSYATTQMAINPDGPKLVRLVNAGGRAVQATGLNKVVRSLDPAPPTYYEAADIVGMVYHNPLVQGRLSRYPVFLAMAERPEFQALANDKEFLEMLDRQAPVPEILANQKTKDILNNPELLNDVWGQVGANLGDLHEYLRTGESKTYSEPILGKWTFEPGATTVALRVAKPTLSALEAKKLRTYLTIAYAKTTLVAMPDKKMVLKDFLGIKPGELVKPEDLNNLKRSNGAWDGADGQYSVSLEDFRDMKATIDKGRLVLNTTWAPLVFTKDE